MMAGGGSVGMGFMWLWMLVPLALVIGGLWLAATISDRRDSRPRGDDAAAILRRRLAAGKIDLTQYEEARAALGLTDPASGEQLGP